MLMTCFTCVDDVLQLLRQLDASKICTGNRSERFSYLAQSHKGVFKDKEVNKLSKVLLGSCMFFYREDEYSSCELSLLIIRHVNCHYSSL